MAVFLSERRVTSVLIGTGRYSTAPTTGLSGSEPFRQDHRYGSVDRAEFDDGSTVDDLCGTLGDLV